MQGVHVIHDHMNMWVMCPLMGSSNLADYILDFALTWLSFSIYSRRHLGCRCTKLVTIFSSSTFAVHHFPYQRIFQYLALSVSSIILENYFSLQKPRGEDH